MIQPTAADGRAALGASGRQRNRATAMKSALIVRPSSLGDIVHAMPVVHDIRQHHPGIGIDWVAEEMFVDLVAMNRGVRTVIAVSLRRWRHVPMATATWREVAAFRRALRSRRYDVVVDLQEQIKGALIGWLARGAVHGPDRASIREPAATLAYRRTYPIDKRQHLIDRCRELAGKAFGYEPVGPPRFGLTVPHTEGPLAGLPIEWLGAPFAVLVHATSREDKLWQEASWKSVIAHLTRAGMKVLLPSGIDSEAARGARLAQGIAGTHVAARLGLAETASLLARAELVCGVDTGLTHLAAALATPTVAVFVATDPELAGVARTGDHARDVGGSDGAPSADEVIAASEIVRVASN